MLYFLLSTLVLTLYIDVVLSLSILLEIFFFFRLGTETGGWWGIGGWIMYLSGIWIPIVRRKALVKRRRGREKWAMGYFLQRHKVKEGHTNKIMMLQCWSNPAPCLLGVSSVLNLAHVHESIKLSFLGCPVPYLGSSCGILNRNRYEYLQEKYLYRGCKTTKAIARKKTREIEKIICWPDQGTLRTPYKHVKYAY